MQPDDCNNPTPIVLTIAGSDSGGGAGIQADIKAISATGGYACSVITAVTAQNTQGVSGVYGIPAVAIEQQLDAVFSDLSVQAVKIGMLHNTDSIHAVARKLRQYQPRCIILDPVMVASSGDVLLEHSAIEQLKQQIFPLAHIMTPNLPEAALLTERSLPTTLEDMYQLVEAMRKIAVPYVLLKGGHLQHTELCTDLFISKNDCLAFEKVRIETQNTHGTGCTLSSAIASFVAQGDAELDAVQRAQAYLHKALMSADQLAVGQGKGPVHHFFSGVFSENTRTDRIRPL